jgi:hypothetical protein
MSWVILRDCEPWNDFFRAWEVALVSGRLRTPGNTDGLPVQAKMTAVVTQLINQRQRWLQDENNPARVSAGQGLYVGGRRYWV